MTGTDRGTRAVPPENDLGRPLTTNHHRRLRTRVGCPALRRCARGGNRRGLRHGIRVIGARPMESRERWRDAPSGALRLPVKVRSIDSGEEADSRTGTRLSHASDHPRRSQLVALCRTLRPRGLIRYTEYVTHDLFGAERLGRQNLAIPARDPQLSLVWTTG